MRMMGNNANNNGHPSSPTSSSSSSSSSWSWPMSIIRIIFLLSCIFEIFSISGYLHNDPHFTSSLSSNENLPLHHHDDIPKPTLNSSNVVVSNTPAGTASASAAAAAAAAISTQRASSEVVSPVILQQSSSLSSINQRIVNCRLQVEKWINPQIETWLENKKKRPILDWVWIMNTSEESSYSLIMFHIEHIVKQSTTSNNTRMKYHGSSGGTWICQDKSNGKNYTAIDVNKRNDIEDKIFLKCNTTSPSKIWFIEDEKEAMNVLEYDVSPLLKCSILEQNNPPFPIVKTQTTSTSSSPNTNTNQKSTSLVSKTITATTNRKIKLGACLKFQGGNLSFQSGNRRKVLQWIIYHRLLGVQHFWLLINESEFNLTGLELGAKDITYLPYNYNWPGYKNRGANGGGNFFQTTAQNQCLYRAKQYNMEWIYTTDVDEYIWLSPTALLDLDNNSKYPLLDYLELHHEQQQENGNDDVGALVMNSIPYGRNRQLQSVNRTFELVIDYTYRKTRDTPWGIRHHRWKCIYHVPVASKLSVHGLDYPENSMKFLNVSQVHINHYKNPHAGVWQGKKEIYEESSLRDRYRNEMMQSLASIRTYP